MDGILNAYKPSGMTSFDVVRRVRRLTGEKRIGHGGTLDPRAEGVLPLFLGRATRLVEYLEEAAKTYEAVVHFGVVTDTYDAAGTVVERRDASLVTRDKIEKALQQFRGEIFQTPPMYSALHHGGRRLYELARDGVEVEREPRGITVHALELVDWRPPCSTLRITCSKGTYIRALAYDLGEELDCGAHLAKLVRTQSGPFSVEEALPITQIEGASLQNTLTDLLLPFAYPFRSWPAVHLTIEQDQAVLAGRSVPLETAHATPPPPLTSPLFWPSAAQDMAVAYAPSGQLRAIVLRDVERHVWKPRKVFP